MELVFLGSSDPEAVQLAFRWTRPTSAEVKVEVEMMGTWVWVQPPSPA
jgi:hypothetical protein